MKRKLLVAVGVLALLGGLFVWWVRKAPLRSRAVLPESALTDFPHEIFARVLQEHVSNGLVRYPSLNKKRSDLDLYVAYINKYSPDTSPALFATNEDKLAYYLNAYNALVLFNVLEHPGLTDLSDAKFDFFYRTTFFVGGESYNLYELENDVVRVRFPDPRIHFALNCASLGCPKLPSEPFLPNKLEAQLERETKLFLADPKNVSVKDGVASISQIFEFYPEDFTNAMRADGSTGSDSELLIGFLNKYRSKEEQLPLSTQIVYTPYDWSLNKL
jgi:hypothetical protein